MMIMFDTKALKKLGFVNYDQLVAFSMLAILEPIKKNDYVKILKKEAKINVDMAKYFLEKGLIEISNDVIYVKKEKKEIILGIKKTMTEKTAKVKELEQVQMVINLWNEIVKDCPQVKYVTTQRIELVRNTCLRFSIDEIKKGFELVQQSDFLTKKEGWCASFDWALKNLERILEGQFTKTKKTKTKL